MNPRPPAIAFILVTLFLDILGIGLLIPILPKLIEQLSGGNVAAASATFGALAALYSAMQFLCSPLLGSLSDRFGRRPVILFSLLGSGLDYLLLAWAPTLPWFFLGRIISGVTGASITAASAYIADVSPPEKRAQNFGLIGAAFGLGFIAGPVLGGVLGNVGLRVPFYVAAGLTLVNWLYGLFVLPESLPVGQRRAFSWARANPVGSLLALRRYPIVLSLTATFFLIHTAHNGVHSTWVLYTSHRYGWDTRAVGLSLALVGLMAMIVQGGLVRVIVPKLGERRAILFGLSLSACVLTGYGLATQGWMIYAILVVGSLGMVSGPAAQGLISRQVPLNEQGAVQGALASLGSLSGIVGPPIAASLFGYFISARAPFYLPGAAFFVSAAMMVSALVLAVRAFRRHPAAPPPVSPAIPAAAGETGVSAGDKVSKTG
ncbi:MAG: TCR/Tet family MFS transporter [Verrucomicrobia bacterium]|nr:TCR/Tet family MFS transporter [Verrucomicrobiota bacterium]